ncbi:hypothetical protein D3C80_2021910 [compost metagenome]
MNMPSTMAKKAISFLRSIGSSAGMEAAGTDPAVVVALPAMGPPPPFAQGLFDEEPDKRRLVLRRGARIDIDHDT